VIVAGTIPTWIPAYQTSRIRRDSTKPYKHNKQTRICQQCLCGKQIVALAADERKQFKMARILVVDDNPDVLEPWICIKCTDHQVISAVC